MAEAEVKKEPPNDALVQDSDCSPLVDTIILKEKRVILVRDLDVETVLVGLTPFLQYNHVDAVNAERNRGDKCNKLCDILQRISCTKYGVFNAFLRIVAGVQPELFLELVGRAPSEDETDFCVKKFVLSLKECIKSQGHVKGSEFDETINFDCDHVQLAIKRDNQGSYMSDEVPHRYQSHLSSVYQMNADVPAVQILDSVGNEEALKRVSVYGRAGTGKTTTFQWLAREWGFNRWAPQFTVLFLLQLRMLLISNYQMTAIELLTLAGLYQVVGGELVKPLSSWLKHAAGKVLIVIDGLDEVAQFTERFKNSPKITDLNQKAHPVDLCLNILSGNLLSGCTVITGSRPFTGLSVMKFDKQLEILGLTEPRIKELVERKHPANAADIMEVLDSSPLLMSVCTITFYCTLISRLLADGVVFRNEDLQTYSRLMAFLIVQCIQRRYSDWSFSIQVGSYFHKLAKMAYEGVFERQLKGELSKLVFNDYDLTQAQMTPEELKSIQGVGLLQMKKVKVGLRQSVTAEFLHFSIQEMLASAHLLTHVLSTDLFDQVFSEGQFNMALLYLFGLEYDTGSDWLNDIRQSVHPTAQNPGLATQMNDFIQDLCTKCEADTDFTPKHQLCQLLYEGQMEDKAKCLVHHIVPKNRLSIDIKQMTLIDLMAVSFVCKYKDSITEICLSNCGLTHTLLGPLTCTLLKDNEERLLELDLGMNEIGAAGAVAISDWLKQNHTLQTLDLSLDYIGEPCATAVAEVLLVNCTLLTLNIEGNYIGDNGAEAIAAALETNKTLQTLIVGINNIGDKGARALATAVKRNSTLHTLEIGSNEIGEMGAIALGEALETNIHLQVLDIGGNKMGINGLTAIAAALQNNSTLHTFNISGSKFGDAEATVVATILKANNTLHTLDVLSNDICKKGARAIAEALQTNCTLHTLDIACNSIGSDGVNALAAALETNSTLQTLHVCRNSIDVAGAAALAIALQTNKTLQELDVTGNDISDDGAAALAAALHHNRTLHTLKARCNNIGQTGATAFGTALQNNSNLRTLILDSNNIDDSGATALVEGLQKNDTLHTLDVGENHISENGAIGMAAALWKNTTLNSLEVDDNDIGTNGAIAIAAAMQNNDNLKLLNVTKNNISEGGPPAIIAALQKNSSNLRVLYVYPKRYDDSLTTYVKFVNGAYLFC